MKAGGRPDPALEPEWVDECLVAKCAACYDHPGSRHEDGSAVCPACAGAAVIVLACRAEARAVSFSVSRPAFASEPTVRREDPVAWGIPAEPVTPVTDEREPSHGPGEAPS